VHETAPASFDLRLNALLPHLGLIVSGGNTLLFEIDRGRRIAMLSCTRDDAAGEALDKGAKLLGLGYPGGPLIEQRAAAGRPDAYRFPRGVQPNEDLSFSFSGLKTSLRYQIEKMSPGEVTAHLADLCSSYQQAVIDALVRKTAAALDRGPSAGNAGGRFASVGLSGGVSNNRLLRSGIETLGRERGIPFLAAQPAHTGDNAAMIAFAAWCDSAGCVAGPTAGLMIAPDLEIDQA